MVTFFYGVLGSLAIALIYAVVAINGLMVGEWAGYAWARTMLRTGRRREVDLEPPPTRITGLWSALGMLAILALFLGALALPR